MRASGNGAYRAMRNHITEYVFLLLLAIIWSASFLLIKIGVETIPPFTLTACRLGVAALIFCLYLALRGEGIPLHPQALLLYAVTGLLGNSLPFVLISWGEIHISSSLTAICMGIMPLSTFVLAHLFIATEPMTKRKSLGLGLGFSGLMMLVGVSALSGIGEHLLGTLSVSAGALCYSLVTVFVRLQPSFSPHKMATGTTLCAALFSIPLAFLIEDPLLVRPSASSFVAVLTLAVFPTAIAAILYFRIIRVLGATVFSQINYLIPILGSLWGALLLSESLGREMLLSLALVLCGIYLIQSKRRSSKRI